MDKEPHQRDGFRSSGTSRREIDYQSTSQEGKQLVERLRDSYGGISNSFSLPADESRCHWRLFHDANGTWTHNYNGYSRRP